MTHMLVTCWSHVGHMLVTCWSHVGHVLVTCWSRVGHVLVTTRGVEYRIIKGSDHFGSCSYTRIFFVGILC
jgi:hypothetical protein